MCHHHASSNDVCFYHRFFLHPNSEIPPKTTSFEPSKTTFSCLLRSSGVAFCRAAVVSSRIRSRWTFRMKKSRAGSMWILGLACTELSGFISKYGSPTIPYKTNR